MLVDESYGLQSSTVPLADGGLIRTKFLSGVTTPYQKLDAVGWEVRVNLSPDGSFGQSALVEQFYFNPIRVTQGNEHFPQPLAIPIGNDGIRVVYTNVFEIQSDNGFVQSELGTITGFASNGDGTWRVTGWTTGSQGAGYLVGQTLRVVVDGSVSGHNPVAPFVGTVGVKSNGAGSYIIDPATIVITNGGRLPTNVASDYYLMIEPPLGRPFDGGPVFNASRDRAMTSGSYIGGMVMEARDSASTFRVGGQIVAKVIDASPAGWRTQVEFASGHSGTTNGGNAIEFKIGQGLAYGGGPTGANVLPTMGYGTLNFLAYYVEGKKVVGLRMEGWTASIGGAASRAYFHTDTITLAELARHVKAIINDLKAHGLLGTEGS